MARTRTRGALVGLVVVGLLALFAVVCEAGVIKDPSLVFWWDASDVNNDGGMTNPANGATVTNWKDKSYNQYDLSGGVGGVYSSSVAALGGMPAVLFDTSHSLYTSALIPSDRLAWSTRNQGEIFMVMQRVGGVVWSKWEGGGTRLGLEGTNRFDFPNDSTGKLVGPTDVTNQWVIYEAQKAPTTQSIYVNGTQDATQANAGALAAASANYVVGANTTGNGLSADINIAEIIIYNRRLSDDERNQIGNYLADKYGISTTYTPSTPQPLLTSVPVSGRFTADNHYIMYLSTSPNVLGTEVARSNRWPWDPNTGEPAPSDWSTMETFAFDVTVGTPMYLQVIAQNDSPVGYAGIIGGFQIQAPPDYVFGATGNQFLLTQADLANQPALWHASGTGFVSDLLDPLTLAAKMADYGAAPWGTTAGPFDPYSDWLWTPGTAASQPVGLAYFNVEFTITSPEIVPEPASLGLLGLGLAALARRRRRR